jgi:hypothetical protein
MQAALGNERRDRHAGKKDLEHKQVPSSLITPGLHQQPPDWAWL